MANVVFVPTGLAYCWVLVGYVVAGLTFYLVFMALAYKMALFEQVMKWPIVSQAALYCGPVLMALGCYFSTKQTTYLMLIPAAIYAALSMLGGLALVGKFNAP